MHTVMIFGGYLMRLTFEQAHLCASAFSSSRPRFLSLDWTTFRKPVPVGCILTLESTVVHTAPSIQHRDKTRAQVRVRARTRDVNFKDALTITGDFFYTFVCEGRHQVSPSTYENCIEWLQAKRRAEIAAKGYPRAMLQKLPAARNFSTSSSKRSRFQSRNRLLTKSYSNSAPLDTLKKKIPAIAKHENIYTIPNALTFSRIILTPVIAYSFLHDHFNTAAALFLYAGVSDMIDGWIARKFSSGSVVGTVIDPMADKTLMTVLTLTLAMKGSIPVWLATMIIGRDVCLGFAALYYRWISLPQPRTFSRYWDFSLPSAEVHPTQISKVNTALQLGLIGAHIAEPVLTTDLTWALYYYQILVAFTTLWSGLSYVYSKDAVKILNQKRDSN